MKRAENILPRKDRLHVVKGTMSPAERSNFVGVKLEKVHELFQVKFVVFVRREWCFIIGTLRFIGRQRDGNGKKTLYDMCL